MKRKPCCEVTDCAECQSADNCPKWYAAFFAGLAETSNVQAAIARAGISSSQVYRLKRSDAEFARCWADALTQGYDNLELETLERLRHGIANDERKYDITNALRLLGMHRDTVAKHRAQRTNRNEEALIRSINAKISTLRQAQQTAVHTIDQLPDRNKAEDT